MKPEQEQEIANLRALNLTPKQIARKLGLRASEVSAVVREQAEKNALAHGKTKTLDPLLECWANGEAVYYFFEDTDSKESKVSPERGLSIVTVARKASYNRIIVCTYLLDYWCLGLKDALGPRKINTQNYDNFIDEVYEAFEEGPDNITLEQAQALVFSAIDYADGLGFKPHRDFQKSKAHLGEWDGQTKLECGRDGKPFYFCGPYDDSNKILKTLQENVGEGNFNYLVESNLF